MKHPFAIAAILLIGLSATVGRAHAFEPCCSVTAIDARTAIVSAKDNASGQVFQFHVPEAAVLRTLRVGAPVFADFATKKASLKPSDPCCSITAISAAPAAAAKTAGHKPPPVNGGDGSKCFETITGPDGKTHKGKQIECPARGNPK